MKIRLRHLIVRNRKSSEQINFSKIVTFLHGPVSTGKSTVVRLIDYCLGGDLERTPAIQQEFVSAELSLILGENECTIERAIDDMQSVRITWLGADNEMGSVIAPLSPKSEPIIGAEVYNLSDLIFYLCGTTPIKVRQRSSDPESPLIRLSIRDIWWYCYLDQTHMDSSFFRLEDPFRGRKSQDAMKFFTGLHSERLSQLESDLIKAADEQRSKREAVKQIRSFMNKFELGSEHDVTSQLQNAEKELTKTELKRNELEGARVAQTHPTDPLRNELRRLSNEIESTRQAIAESTESINEQKALRAELITAKTKAVRADQAGRILERARYQRCPECGTEMSDRSHDDDLCTLCGSSKTEKDNSSTFDLEILRRDLNERIDQITDSIERRERELSRIEKLLAQLKEKKSIQDRQLQIELARYDSAFIESIREAEREIATLTERIRFLQRLQQMPQAINDLEEEAGKIQGTIDRLKTLIMQERSRLRAADENIAAIAAEFKRIMLTVSFPGVTENDEVVIDPRNWRPTIVHGNQEWTFWDAGSGGKKTLFNVCYALAIHAVGVERGMPIPGILIIDSPTKNISDDENPELVRALYDEIYHLSNGSNGSKIQFLLIDSDLVKPNSELPDFSERKMAGTPEAPSLIPYYTGP